MTTWRAVYSYIGVKSAVSYTPESARLDRIVQSMEVIKVCGIAKASALVDNETPTPGNAAAMQAAVTAGERQEPDVLPTGRPALGRTHPITVVCKDFF